MHCWDSRREEYDDTRRATRACVRPDLPAVKPSPSLEQFAAGYHGRAPVRLSVVREEFGEWGKRLPPNVDRTPPESPAEGCPGAWYRSPFVASLRPYLRLGDSNGNRVDNLLLRDAPSLVLEAVTEYEAEASRHTAHWHAIEQAQWEADRKRDEAKRGKR